MVYLGQGEFFGEILDSRQWTVVSARLGDPANASDKPTSGE
jgi:hypothetical protein